MTKLAGKTNIRLSSTMGYALYILLGWNGVLIPSLILSLENKFHLSDAAFGGFYFISAFCSSAGALTGGFLIERFGRRAVLTTAAALFGLGLLCMSFAPVWTVFLIAALLVNYTTGLIDGGVNGLFLDLYADKDSSRALNLLHLFYSIGAFTGPFIIGQVLAAGIAWQITVLVISLITITNALLLTFQKIPSGKHTHEEATAPQKKFSTTEKSLLPFIGLAIAICCYVAAEIGVTNWLVKYLHAIPVNIATGTLSVFWLGIAVGRLLSSRISHKVSHMSYTIACLFIASISLIVAVLIPFPFSVIFFGITGLFFGPIYPMIMVIGGDIYPHRLAMLSGSLGASSIFGSLLYPPLMGVIAQQYSLQIGMLGTGLLGLPAVIALLFASYSSKKIKHTS